MVAIMRDLVPRANMIDTEQSIAIFVVGLIFTITSILSVVLRVWAKRVNKGSLGIEDYLCFLSLVCVVGLFIGIVLHIQLGGMGHHVADIPMMDVSYTLQILIAYQSLYAIGVGAIKSSIVYFYIRIFFTVNRPMRLASYAVIAFIWGWVIMSVLVAFLSCTPFEFTWNPTVPGGHCDNEVGSFVAEATLDLVADLMVLALPMRSIWKLHINTGKKVSLFVVFGLGFTTMIMAILRIIGLANLDYEDFEWTAPAPIVYSLLEPAIGITVACMPLMQPLLKNTWLGRQIGGGTRKTTKPSGYGYQKDKNFERLNDDGYPLNSYNANSVNITGAGSISEEEMTTSRIERQSVKHGGIIVKHEITTHTS